MSDAQTCMGFRRPFMAARNTIHVWRSGNADVSSALQSEVIAARTSYCALTSPHPRIDAATYGLLIAPFGCSQDFFSIEQ